MKAASIDILPRILLKDSLDVPAKLIAYICSFLISFNKLSGIFNLAKGKFLLLSKLLEKVLDKRTAKHRHIQNSIKYIRRSVFSWNILAKRSILDLFIYSFIFNVDYITIKN